MVRSYSAIFLYLCDAMQRFDKSNFNYYIYFAFLLSWFVSRILLTILFIFVLTPIAIFAKLFKKDFLDLSNTNSRQSYWERKEYKFSNYEKMY